jgi:hypothetical protein
VLIQGQGLLSAIPGLRNIRPSMVKTC